MDDLISRQDAVKSMTNAIWHYPNEMYAQLNSYEMAEALAKDGLMFIPSAQQWIPCSEKMPPELKPVNVTWINRQPPTYYEKLKNKPFTDTAVYYDGKWYWQSAICVDLLKEYGENPADYVAYGIEIVAWQPLPEPYRGENNG